MYTNYDFYKNEYNGTLITPSTFNLYIGMAGDYIYSATLGRATCENRQVKLCECRIADILFSNNEASENKNTQKTSEKVGDYSVTYADKSLNESDLSDKITATIYRYLAVTGLLYRGLR